MFVLQLQHAVRIIIKGNLIVQPVAMHDSDNIVQLHILKIGREKSVMLMKTPVRILFILIDILYCQTRLTLI